jgi:hypothetical protein
MDGNKYEYEYNTSPGDIDKKKRSIDIIRKKNSVAEFIGLEKLVYLQQTKIFKQCENRSVLQNGVTKKGIVSKPNYNMIPSKSNTVY